MDRAIDLIGVAEIAGPLIREIEPRTTKEVRRVLVLSIVTTAFKDLEIEISGKKDPMFKSVLSMLGKNSTWVNARRRLIETGVPRPQKISKPRSRAGRNKSSPTSLFDPRMRAKIKSSNRQAPRQILPPLPLTSLFPEEV